MLEYTIRFWKVTVNKKQYRSVQSLTARLTFPPEADDSVILHSMYTVYVLVNRAGMTYVGQTNNLERRLRDHNKNQSKFTKNKGPFSVLLTEIYPNRSEAVRRELFLKSGKGRAWLKQYRSVV